MNNFIQSPLNKQRKDKFIAVIPIPKGLKSIQKKFTRNNFTILPDSFTMSIIGTVAPAIVVPAINNRYAGQSLNVTSYTREPYSPLTFNFTVDNRYNNYWFIYKWLDILNDDDKSIYDAAEVTGIVNTGTTPNGTSTSNFDKAIQYYSTDMTIYALDEYEKRVAQFTYTKAFPTRLGNIDFNYRDATELEVSVEFAYSQFNMDLIDYVESL